MLLAVREDVNMSSLGNKFNQAMLGYIIGQAKEEILLKTEICLSKIKMSLEGNTVKRLTLKHIEPFANWKPNFL